MNSQVTNKTTEVTWEDVIELTAQIGSSCVPEYETLIDPVTHHAYQVMKPMTFSLDPYPDNSKDA